MFIFIFFDIDLTTCGDVGKKTILKFFFLFNKIWLSVSECVFTSDNIYLILNLLTFGILKINNHNKVLILFLLFSIAQQTTLLFYNNTGRFAYFPWFIMLLNNIMIIKNYYNFSFMQKKNFNY